MARYINTETARIYVSDFVCEQMEKIPTADVAEVKHGEWQRQKNGFYFVCSVCGKAAATKGNYCHSCGAKMDGGKAE